VSHRPSNALLPPSWYIGTADFSKTIDEDKCNWPRTGDEVDPDMLGLAAQSDAPLSAQQVFACFWQQIGRYTNATKEDSDHFFRVLLVFEVETRLIWSCGGERAK
jgi:hypothetical protein